MAIQYTDFQPNNTSPFQFQVILDGSQFNVVVTWNIFGQRYYVNIYTMQGVLVVSRPMVGSPYGFDISLFAGYFISTLVYRADNKQFEISDQPISYPDFGKQPDAMLDTQLNQFVLDQSVLGDADQMLGVGGKAIILDQNIIGS
jgi:hypothetical protein